jgi:hypothetical protein
MTTGDAPPSGMARRTSPSHEDRNKLQSSVLGLESVRQRQSVAVRHVEIEQDEAGDQLFGKYSTSRASNGP